MAHQAFQRHPTGDSGVLSVVDFTPLTLVGSVLSVVVYHDIARVTLKVEYRNSASAAQDVFAAFQIPPRWTLVSSRADASTTNNFVLSEIAAQEKPVYQQYQLLEGAPELSVATLAIPWTLMVGQCLVAQATFLAPLEEGQLTIPKTLFPAVSTPSETSAGWRNAFVINAPPKLKSGVIAVKITGTTLLPNTQPPSTQGTPAGNTKSSLLGDPRSFEITFEEESLAPAEDYIISFSPQSSTDPLQLHTMLETNEQLVAHDSSLAVTLAVAPTFTRQQLANANAEFIFVIGAGNGATDTDMDSLRRALSIAICGLPASCNVNIVNCVGNTAKSDVWLAEKSIPVTSELLGPSGTVERFLCKLAPFSHISAEGPQNDEVPMKRPIAIVRELITNTEYVQGLARNIIVLTTDGGDKQALLTAQVAASNVHSTSISTLALDWFGTADIPFLRHLAEVSNGRCAVCRRRTAQDTTDELLALVDALTVPALTNTSIVFQSSSSSSSTSPLRICGYPDNAIPLIRHGAHPFLIRAFGPESLQNFTVTVEGLVGDASVRYMLSSPEDVIASSDKNSGVKGDPLTASLPHVKCAWERIHHLVTGNTGYEEVIALAASYTIPCYLTSFRCRNEKGKYIDKALIVPQAHPTRRHVLGRGAAVTPTKQGSAVSVTSQTVPPRPNVAVSARARERLVKEEATKVNAARAARESALEQQLRRDKVQGLLDDETIVAQRNQEKLDIAAMSNTLQNHLNMKPLSTREYFKSIIEEIVNAVCAPRSAYDLVLTQHLDGRFSISTLSTLSAMNLTKSQVENNIPVVLTNVSQAGDAWVTALAIHYLQQTQPKAAVLAVKKARAFLAELDVNPDTIDTQAEKFLEEQQQQGNNNNTATEEASA